MPAARQGRTPDAWLSGDPPAALVSPPAALVSPDTSVGKPSSSTGSLRERPSPTAGNPPAALDSPQGTTLGSAGSPTY
ncbi:MAG: hypothetical protein KME49_28690 [Brasilonema octagenarum HA4186-MV1]|jgi:hypothetical protein|nr:hypothetical protein [Brasilonema octagenarum HA4186-MV1]